MSLQNLMHGYFYIKRIINDVFFHQVNQNSRFFQMKSFFFVPDRNIKVDCISVSTSPVKSTIDDLIQQLFDALLASLRRSITNEVQTIDAFLTSATEALSSRPQTVEEIGEANAKHAELATEKLKACL